MSTSDLFHVILRCDAAGVAKIISEGLGQGVQLISAEKIESPAEKARSSGSRYAEGVRNKGISGEALLLQLLNDQPLRAHTLIELGNKFVEYGFARNSVSPVISKAVNAGQIKALGAGKYCSKQGGEG